MSLIDDMLQETKMIELAIIIANIAHFGQKDKIGKPYILHPLAVAHLLDEPSVSEFIVAILHDVIEDTHITLEFFKDFYCRGELVFYDEIIEALDAISKRKDETNRQYYARVKQNPIALKVKFADIKHNSSSERLAGLPEEVATGLQKKYEKALSILTEKDDRGVV